MAGALPNGGVLAVQDPFKQQKSNWFHRRKEGGEVVMLNKTRKRIYDMCPELGKKADGLVLKRKTSFISLAAKAFMGRELEIDPRRAKVDKYVSEATTMEQTYNSVTIKRANGDDETMSMSAYKKLKTSEEEKMQMEKTPGYNSLNQFLEQGKEQNTPSSSSSSNISQITSGKKRKRREEEKEEETSWSGKNVK